jgi:hypothetical protein
VFEEKKLRNTDEGKGRYAKPHNKDLHNIYSSQNIIRTSKSKIM